eukprot:164521-Rhodomonas_salina.1
MQEGRNERADSEAITLYRVCHVMLHRHHNPGFCHVASCLSHPSHDTVTVGFKTRLAVHASTANILFHSELRHILSQPAIAETAPVEAPRHRPLAARSTLPRAHKLCSFPIPARLSAQLERGHHDANLD